MRAAGEEDGDGVRDVMSVASNGGLVVVITRYSWGARDGEELARGHRHRDSTKHHSITTKETLANTVCLEVEKDVLTIEER